MLFEYRIIKYLECKNVYMSSFWWRKSLSMGWRWNNQKRHKVNYSLSINTSNIFWIGNLMYDRFTNRKVLAFYVDQSVADRHHCQLISFVVNLTLCCFVYHRSNCPTSTHPEVDSYCILGFRSNCYISFCTIIRYLYIYPLLLPFVLLMFYYYLLYNGQSHYCYIIIIIIITSKKWYIDFSSFVNIHYDLVFPLHFAIILYSPLYSETISFAKIYQRILFCAL